MGWNTWNRYYCDINQTIIYTNTDSLIRLGLADLGYKYVNIDDCWLTKERDSQGHAIVDPATFPDGMKAIGDYIHSHGLKFGIYNSAGTMTCEGRAGSLHHESIDVADFVEWGVDFLKYDNCFNEGIPSKERYENMRNALSNASRPIFFSICNWGLEDVTEWGPGTGNSWRTAGDITPTWGSVKYNFEMNQLHPEVAGPGAWNDPDMLEVGNHGLTHEEERTHFALWSIVKAPLIIGCDLNTVTDESLAILKNKNLIAVNQDPLGKQAVCVAGCGS
jgi:alpha-galactosidase